MTRNMVSQGHLSPPPPGMHGAAQQRDARSGAPDPVLSTWWEPGKGALPPLILSLLSSSDKLVNV